MMNKPHVLQILSMYHPEGERIMQEGARVTRTDCCEISHLCEKVRDVEAIVLRAPARITQAVIDAAPRLRVISGAGVGLDNIDVAYATKKGIPVLHAPSVNGVSTAEHAVMLLMAAAKSLVPFHEQMRTGNYGSRMQIPAYELKGKTVGLIGFGSIAREVAKRLRFGMEMNVRAWIRAVDAEKEAAAARLEASLTTDLDAVFAESDFVSLHIPLNEHTRGLVDAKRLRLMKPGAYLINTARGGVVDQDALAAALQQGLLAGAALDVFEPEPPPADHPLLALPNVLLTPHVGGTTVESNLIMASTVARNVLLALAGERPPQIGNPDVWDMRVGNEKGSKEEQTR